MISQKMIENEKQRIEYFESQKIKYESKNQDGFYDEYINEHIIPQIKVSEKRIEDAFERERIYQERRENFEKYGGRDDVKWRPVRDAAIARDGGCKKCGSVEKMHGHHIYNFADYPSKRYDVSNVVIFCESCHIKFHQKYGKSFNNPDQVKEFIG